MVEQEHLEAADDEEDEDEDEGLDDEGMECRAAVFKQSYLESEQYLHGQFLYSDTGSTTVQPPQKGE